MDRPTNHSSANGDMVPDHYHRNLEWLYSQTRSGAPRSPARMSRLIDALRLSFPPANVHVVGTNGKGTVTAMIAAGAAAAGLRSGAFTSPHVEEFEERVTVAGGRIHASFVNAFIEQVRRGRFAESAAFFELTFALALSYWQTQGVELGVVEAGVGAREDATLTTANVVLTVISPIAADHLGTLGPTLADVAENKAAAIRPGVPVVSAAQQPEVLAVLQRVALERGALLTVDGDGDDAFETGTGAYPGDDPVRIRNLRLAAAALHRLGFGSEAVSAAVSLPPLPGRAERFQLGTRHILLDGAHDPAAAAALRERVAGSYTLLFGSLARKQGEATLSELERNAERIFVTRAGGQPVTVEAAGRRLIADPAAALHEALRATPEGGMLVIAGSLYLAGELRPELRRLAGARRTDILMTEGI